MKKVSSVFGKFIISAMLITGLAACNTNQRSEEVRVKERKDGSEEVRIKQDVDNDSVKIDRDATIRKDEDGYGDTKVKDNTKVDLERDRGDADNNSSTRNR
jgi:hypothetical protein